MASFKKGLFILGLLVVSLTASAFMVLEAGHYYQSLYPQSSFGYMGYLAATLNEAFMAIMAGVWLPGKVRGKGHPVNFLFRFLLVLLFLTTVGGASFNAISEHLALLEGQANNRAVVEILKSQIEDHEKSLATFSEQRQKMNSALTVRNQLATKQKLVEAMEHQKAVTGLWLQVIFLVVLRVAVQLANLSCVWLIGWIWRRKEALPLEVRPTGTPAESKPKSLGAGAPSLLDGLLQGSPELAWETTGGGQWQGREALLRSKAPQKRTFAPPMDRGNGAGAPAGTSSPAAVQDPIPWATKTPEATAASLSARPEMQAPKQERRRPEEDEVTRAGGRTKPASPQSPLFPESGTPIPSETVAKVGPQKPVEFTPANQPPVPQTLAAEWGPQVPTLELVVPSLGVLVVEGAEQTAPAKITTKVAPQEASTANLAPTTPAPQNPEPQQEEVSKTEPAFVGIPVAVPSSKEEATKVQTNPAPAEPLAATVVAPEPSLSAPSQPQRAGKALPFPQKTKAPAAPKAPVAEDQDFERQELKRLRTRIVRLANQRNPGVSLSAFCAALGESPVDLREIANFQAELAPQLAERLEEIVGKIERLHQSQWAVNG